MYQPVSADARIFLSCTQAWLPVSIYQQPDMMSCEIPANHKKLTSTLQGFGCVLGHFRAVQLTLVWKQLIKQDKLCEPLSALLMMSMRLMQNKTYSVPSSEVPTDTPGWLETLLVRSENV